MSLFRGIRLPIGWHEADDSLIYRLYRDPSKPKNVDKVRIAGFDFDDTLVRKHDHTLVFRNVIEKLKQLHDDGFLIAIFTNEALDHLKKPQGIANCVLKKLGRLDEFANKLDFPIQSFVATRYDGYRKPSSSDKAKKKPPGGNLMWKKMIELLKLEEDDIDLEGCIYVGDSAGRGRDFSDADLSFARCCGVTFQLPEEFFGADDSKSSKNQKRLWSSTEPKVAESRKGNEEETAAGEKRERIASDNE